MQLAVPSGEVTKGVERSVVCVANYRLSIVSDGNQRFSKTRSGFILGAEHRNSARCEKGGKYTAFLQQPPKMSCVRCAVLILSFRREDL